jgi:hypothetical protein
MVVAIILSVLGVWLVLGLVRMRMNAASDKPADAQHQGLMPGLLGGLFGAMAGHWIYDTIFQRGGSKAPEITSPTDSPPVEEPAKEETPANQT